ncbi:permease [Marinomonas transparens]|uniref:Permease n=1 Tax=Marinomonas transparens TaxID=2795388 RepID=A0A934JRY7_9GAMM|nr:permease [Marinomonas transparens]MBJ7537186.1 permease [Marinomonas transparens]
MYAYLEGLIESPEIQSMLISSAEMFMKLFIELTLLFIVISYGVALINQKLPAEKIQKLLGGRKGRGYLTAAGLGAITPFCSCSTIPMLIGLLKARAGFGTTMTFLFTSPLLNPIVIALFIPVLGLQVTIWYAGFALTTSIIAGVLLQRFGFDRYIKQEMLETKASGCGTVCDASQETSCCGSVEKQEPTIWSEAWQECWSLFRSMFPYMFIAMLIGAFVHGFVPADFFADVASADNPAAVPTAALIGIPLYIRVTALLPLVASFIAKGVSIGAIIALVIGSGGASLPEMILLKRLFHWPLMLAFLMVIFSMAVIGGFAFNLFIG